MKQDVRKCDVRWCDNEVIISIASHSGEQKDYCKRCGGIILSTIEIMHCETDENREE